MPIQPNKAIVGKNAFAHSSGIHQHGILRYRQNYEIIDPTEIGLTKNKIILTARSGRSALNYKVKNLGYKISRKQLDKLYENFLQVADNKRKITNVLLQKLIKKTLDL
jgi:2-isopropylmalate synthase